MTDTTIYIEQQQKKLTRTRHHLLFIDLFTVNFLAQLAPATSCIRVSVCLSPPCVLLSVITPWRCSSFGISPLAVGALTTIFNYHTLELVTLATETKVMRGSSRFRILILLLSACIRLDKAVLHVLLHLAGDLLLVNNYCEFFLGPVLLQLFFSLQK